MPRAQKAPPSRDEPRGKREGLKLSQLASYDDLLTDALVDHVYFWTRIRKNRSRYFASRGIREENVTSILQQCVIVEKDAPKACARLLELPGLKRTFEGLSKYDQEHFHRHLRKYVEMYLPDCSFEVSTTNRYTIETQEAATTARKPIRKGELIKYLVGIQVEITPEEEKTLDLSRQDFSIVMSSRKRTQSLFLGPARFANHDCNANARLTSKGHNAMTVIASKDIAVGDEITVSYGDDYFGIDNCECLCATCESFGRNGWDPTMSRDVSDEESEDDINEPFPGGKGATPVKSKRTRSSGRSAVPDTLRFQAQTVKASKDDVSRLLRKVRSRLLLVRAAIKSLQQLQESRVSFEEDTLKYETTLQFSEANTVMNLGQEKVLLENEVDRLKSQATDLDAEEIMINSEIASIKAKGTPTRKRKLEDSSPNSAPENTPKHPRLEELRNSPLKRSPSRLKHQFIPTDGDDAAASAGFEQQLDRAKSSSPSVNGSKSQSRLSTPPTLLSDRAQQPNGETHLQKSPSSSARTPEPEAHETSQTRLTRASLARAPFKGNSASPKIHVDEQSSSSDPAFRRPGDYTLTTRLLATPYSRWVECRVCDEYYVQSDSYQLRWSCPRCERHSKLYGYQWPKTDKEGKHDMEERILDHRVVNRFVAPDEAKYIKRGQKGKPIFFDVDSEDIAQGQEHSSQNTKESIAEASSRPVRQQRSLEDATCSPTTRNQERHRRSVVSRQRSTERKPRSKESSSKETQVKSDKPQGYKVDRLRRTRMSNAGKGQSSGSESSDTDAKEDSSALQRKSARILNRPRNMDSNSSTAAGSFEVENSHEASSSDIGFAAQRPARSIRGRIPRSFETHSKASSIVAEVAADLQELPPTRAKLDERILYAISEALPSVRALSGNLPGQVSTNGDRSIGALDKSLTTGKSSNSSLQPTQRVRTNSEGNTPPVGEGIRASSRKIKSFVSKSPVGDSKSPESVEDATPASPTRSRRNHSPRSVRDMIENASRRRFGLERVDSEPASSADKMESDVSEELRSTRSTPRLLKARSVSDLLESASRRRFDSSAIADEMAETGSSNVAGKLKTPSISRRLKAY